MPTVSVQVWHGARIAFHAACRGCSAAVTAFLLNYLGLALFPAPRLPGGSVTAAKSNPWCRCGMLALPAHLRTGPRGPRQPVAQHGVPAIWQSSLLVLPKWLNPFPITGKWESGADPVPVLLLSPAPQSPSPAPAQGAPSAVPAWHCWTRGRHSVARHTRHSRKGALATTCLTVTGINY